VKAPAAGLREAKYRVAGCQSAAFLRVNGDGSADVWADALISRGVGLTVVERLQEGCADFSDLRRSLSSGRVSGIDGFVAAYQRQTSELAER
jgi:sulfur transfer protein SufE